MTSCCTSNPFLKGFYSKRKEFAPTGSKFFPFTVDPFSEGRQNNMTELPPLKDDRCSLSRSVHQQNVIHIHKHVCISIIKFWYVCLPRLQVGEILLQCIPFLSFLSFSRPRWLSRKHVRRAQCVRLACCIHIHL